MKPNKSVLVVGITPEQVDFSAFPGMNAEKVRAGIGAEVARLCELGYAAQSVWIDVAVETAEPALAERLGAERFDCVVLGAGIRVPPANFLLFERLLNLVHARAPQAKIGFNTNPSDTAEAARRWV